MSWRLPGGVPLAVVERLTHDIVHPDVRAVRYLGHRRSVFVDRVRGIGAVAVKEYRRGGQVRRVVDRHHLRGGPTRGERELRALRLVRSFGVRAPEPVACASRGLLFYRAWLLTRYVPNRGTMAAMAGRASARRLADAAAATAEQVALLMAHRVLHVDLHAGNVILGPQGLPWLLDFDRAVAFQGPFDQLRNRYVARWQRFVRKNRLPDVVGDAFASELYRLTRLEVESLLGPVAAEW
ncbi:MAG: hypothetical protein KJ061_01460 [Vicinamibacteraceae bacterium]|nr:hypothetical protein [Vicinamibacteraceae bacterium]